MAVRINKATFEGFLEKYGQSLHAKMLEGDAMEYVKARTCSHRNGERFHKCIERKCAECTFTGFFVKSESDDPHEVISPDYFFGDLEGGITLESLMGTKILLHK